MFLSTSSPYEASRLLSQLLSSESVPDGFFTGSLFTEEFLPCVFLQHTHKEPWYGSALEVAQILEVAQNDKGCEIGRAIDEHRTRAQQPGYRLTYGNHAFDTAVRSALTEHHSDPTALWQALEAAMAHWQPRTPDHIAPVALLADPVLAYSLTPERGRALLSKPRSGR